MLLKRTIWICGIAALIMFVISLFMPSRYQVQRSAIINASPEKVFAEVNDLKNWPRWDPWSERDAEIKYAYSERTNGEGAWQQWKSNMVGNGELVIRTVQSQKLLTYELVFPDYKIHGIGEMRFEPVSNGTKVTWIDYGDVGWNPAKKIFCLLSDHLVGSDFERGLSKLKEVCEKDEAIQAKR